MARWGTPWTPELAGEVVVQTLVRFPANLSGCVAGGFRWKCVGLRLDPSSTQFIQSASMARTAIHAVGQGLLSSENRVEMVNQVER